MSKTFIGLGSNLEEPIIQIKKAVSAIQDLPYSCLHKVSGLYFSKPWGTVINQPDFVNVVLSLETEFSPYELLEQLQVIEKKQKRVKHLRWGPRTIDCDILLFDTLKINSPELTIPHPYLEQRAFVMVPLAEIAPDLILPSGAKVADLVEERFDDISCRCLSWNF